MISPNKITDYNRTEAELQEFLIFSFMVAGKNSAIESKKLEQFLKGATRVPSVGSPLTDCTPFDLIRSLIEHGTLEATLKHYKIAPYKSRLASFIGVAEIMDIKTVGFIELIQIKGISYKTASFFLTHSREDYEYPVLDTHILKWLKSLGYDVPKATPASFTRYQICAQFFIAEAKKRGKTIADLDLEVWKQFAKC